MIEDFVATEYAFDVVGLPAPQGSKRHVGRGVMVESSKAVKPWRESVVWQAREAGLAGLMLDGPVMLLMQFRLPRPRGHYGTGRNAATLKPSAPAFPTTKPDADKLARAVGDALTTAGIVADDSRIVAMTVTKAYATPGSPAGVTVRLGLIA